MKDRQALRNEMKKRRARVSMIEVLEMSARMAERVLRLPQYANAKRVMCYIGIGTEVNTYGLLREIIRSGRELYVPVTLPKRQMKAARLTSFDQLHKGRFGIPEPVEYKEIAPEKLDLILVPGLAFDLNGNRLGYGGGYYDRFLPKTQAKRVGICYEEQLLPCVPAEEHDVPMDMLVTQSNVYPCGN